MGLFWDKLRIERTADGANALCIIVQFCKLTIFLKDQAAIGTFIYGMSAVAVGFRKLQFTAAIPVMVAGTHGTDPVTRPIHPVFVRTAGFFVDFAAVVTLLIMLVGQDDPLTVGAVTQRLAGFLGLLTATFTFDYPDTGFGTGGTVGRLLAVVRLGDDHLAHNAGLAVGQAVSIIRIDPFMRILTGYHFLAGRTEVCVEILVHALPELIFMLAGLLCETIRTPVYHCAVCLLHFLKFVVDGEAAVFRRDTISHRVSFTARTAHIPTAGQCKSQGQTVTVLQLDL